MKILTFGEIIWDVYGDEKVIGGAAFNFAAHAGHLGHDSYLISALGNDELGDEALILGENHLINMSLVQRNGYETGKCVVTLNDRGVPVFNVQTGSAYDMIECGDELIERIKEIKPDMLCFGTLIQRSPISRRSIRRIVSESGIRNVFCDINIRKDCYDRDSLDYCLSRATIVKISDEEGHFIADLGLVDDSDVYLPKKVAAAYANLEYVVYTLGSKGSEVFETATGITYKSGRPGNVKVVSTVGAGDCFGATFSTSLLSGCSVPEAIRRATDRSDIVVAHREAIPF